MKGWFPRTQPIRGVGPRELDIARNQLPTTRTRRVCAVCLCPCARANSHRRHAGRTPGSVSAAAPHAGLGAPGPEPDLIAASRYHRIIRRGRNLAIAPCRRRCSPMRRIRAVGDYLAQCEDLAPVRVHPERVAVQRQVRRPGGEADPLLGNREPMPAGPTDGFTLPQLNGISRRIDGLTDIHRGAGRCVFLSARDAGAAALRAVDRWACCAHPSNGSRDRACVMRRMG